MILIRSFLKCSLLKCIFKMTLYVKRQTNAQSTKKSMMSYNQVMVATKVNHLPLYHSKLLESRSHIFCCKTYIKSNLEPTLAKPIQT